MTVSADPRPVVLIADDENVTRLMLSEAAEQAGLAVITVGDGTAAVNVGLQTKFALAILDVEMPGMDGYQVCRALRQSTHGADVPIIMITGHDDAASVDRAYEAGATDFVSKPLNWPLVPHRLRYILRNADAMCELRSREAENRALIESIPDRIHLVTPDGRILRTLSGQQDLGASLPEVSVPESLLELLPTDARRDALRTLRLTANDGLSRSGEYEDTEVEDGPRHYEMRYIRCRAGEVMAIRRDISARRTQERRIRQLAYFDQLTGLPNRESFVEKTAAAMREAEGEGASVAVLQLDLNGFKRINDTFGHSIGDELLRVVSGQLAQCLRDVAGASAAVELARLGGDEFAICIRDAKAEEQAAALAIAIRTSFADPLRCNEHEFFVSPSIGIAIHPAHGRDVETLLKNANSATSHAKAAGSSGQAIYADVMNARALEWLSLDARLRRALRDEQLVLYFQPKFRLADDSLVGAEALLRWFHPELGEISPGRFIPLAEETGLILDIGRFVVRAACRQLRYWRNDGFSTTIAINVSGKEFLHGDPAALIAREAAAASIEPSCIEVEITESILVSDSANVQRGLRELKRLGCRIALDDFGTGYSSLAYLQRFPPDRLKVDRAFIVNVHRERGDAAIFNSIMSLATSLGLAITAEGVEHAAQLEWLRDHGCHEAQGYLLGRPMPAGDLELLFAQRGAASQRALG